MTQSGFLDQKPRSPGSLAIVIALHGAAIAALMLARHEYSVTPDVVPKVYDVKDDTVPPPVPPPDQVEPKQQTQSRLDTVVPLVQPPVFDRVQITEPPMPQPFIPNPGPIGPAVDYVPDPPKPISEPVRLAARLDQGSQLQPPYPAAEERAEVEGSVVVKILIGTDGRVKSVEKVSATSDAFFRATERQALRHWRFKPATVDGRPVESRQTMTVRFQLNA